MPRFFIAESPADLAQAVDAAADQLRRWTPDLSTDAIPAIEALLVLGEFAAVRRLLEAGSGDPRLDTIVLGRYLAWSGDLRPADARRSIIRGAISAATADAPLLAAAACAAAERLAGDLADPRLAADARAAGRACGAGSEIQPEAEADLVAHVLGVRRQALTTPGTPEHDVAFSGDAPIRLLHIAHRVLGLEPDATRHRLRLQPPDWPLQLREIPFGDGSVSLEVRRAGPATVEFALEQESGAIPVTALLEPRLSREPLRVEVDGRGAELTPRPLPGGGTQLPVQLVLDAPRVLAVIGIGGSR